jgi:hypothetical protein
MPYKISERTATARIMKIINKIIEDENLPFYRADVELIKSKKSKPDIIKNSLKKT